MAEHSYWVATADGRMLQGHKGDLTGAEGRALAETRIKPGAIVVVIDLASTPRAMVSRFQNGTRLKSRDSGSAPPSL
jgi:hypothetical protein